MSELPALKNLLSRLNSGPIPPDRVETVKDALAAAWPELAGGHETEMTPWKVNDRAEKLTWDRDRHLISFQIERHGAASFGSTYAEVYEWRVNVELGTAEGSFVGKGRSGHGSHPGIVHQP